MPYKDKEKQKQAVKKAVNKFRGITTSNTNVIPRNTPNVIPSSVIPVIPDLAEENSSLKGRILFLTEQLIFANQELSELKKENERLKGGLVVKSESLFSLPIYSWQTAKAGEKYRRFTGGRWIEIVAPEVDGEGNEVKEG